MRESFGQFSLREVAHHPGPESGLTMHEKRANARACFQTDPRLDDTEECLTSTNSGLPLRETVLASCLGTAHIPGMTPPGGEEADTPLPPAVFATTHWSVVLNAANPGSTEAGEALERLCRAYWYPLYAFVRRKGHDAVEAQDLTQAFFARLLEKNYLAQADRARGRFRTFLLSALNHFLADEWDKANRQKRGGGKVVVSFDQAAAEERYQMEPVDELDPAKIYERRWVTTLFDNVFNRLEQEFTAQDKSDHFAHLRDLLTGEKPDNTYAEIGERLGMSESAVKKAVQRMRERYRQLFREEIAQTVGSAAEIEDELRHVSAVIRR